ncbi:hypothetical protein BDP81DRAFT_417750 [Colletotrichum phormii]|uniref:Uncharacterized protein n=1 Tax=Colletotrichum phormii TaxID=359342 RepID=A0AAJ0EHX8_9PEZI|nr:uncharacterized protein BDP81DRAFT_417750 [Colletotrichum phormii]KAK1640957.1 hypothetical protein BDP81DRAFT_417750 [Colletotrichum phormii]
MELEMKLTSWSRASLCSFSATLSFFWYSASSGMVGRALVSVLVSAAAGAAAGACLVSAIVTVGRSLLIDAKGDQLDKAGDCAHCRSGSGQQSRVGDVEDGGWRSGIGINHAKG